MKTFFSALLIIGIIILGCRKETNSSNTVSSSRIKRLQVESKILLLQGEIDNIDFKYDNSDRVTSITAYNFQPPIGSPPSFDSIFNLIFEYSGNNSLPSKVINKQFYIGSFPQHLFKSYEHFLSYDATNRPRKDSVILHDFNGFTFFSHKDTFQYSGSNIFRFDSTSLSSGTSLINISNGNIQSVKTFPNPNAWDLHFDFDAGLNLLNTLNIAPIYFVIADYNCPIGDFWTMWTITNKNNMIRAKTGYNQTNGTFSDTALLNYEYDPNGLPQKRFWIRHAPGIVDSIDLIKYFYQ